MRVIFERDWAPIYINIFTGFVKESTQTLYGLLWVLSIPFSLSIPLALFIKTPIKENIMIERAVKSMSFISCHLFKHAWGDCVFSFLLLPMIFVSLQ